MTFHFIPHPSDFIKVTGQCEVHPSLSHWRDNLTCSWMWINVDILCSVTLRETRPHPVTRFIKHILYKKYINFTVYLKLLIMEQILSLGEFANYNNNLIYRE
ncbi:hypothetical protein HS7_10330 [Sulfolobales archaeon HS-7]|nr:hypothetical protein HS7_10330 [Sulfolobales archaeon HS-7]